MKNWWLWLLLIPLKGITQDVKTKEIFRLNEFDSLNLQERRSHFFSIPKRATQLALIPGLGQLYNRDYWKLPIVYLSIAGGIYTWHLNNLKYQVFLTGYKQFYDLNPLSSAYGQRIPEMVGSEVSVRVRNLLDTKSETHQLSHDIIARNKDYWRRNRNLSIIVTGLAYSLSIIEANVAAHLKSFDVSDDISIRITPKLVQPEVRQPTPGVRLVFNLK